MAHDNAVRMYSYIPSNIITLLKKARKQLSIMKTTPSKFKPFVLVTNDETKKCVITAGRFQVTPYEFENEKQAEKYMEEQPYDMMINLYAILRYAEENENQNPQGAKENA